MGKQSARQRAAHKNAAKNVAATGLGRLSALGPKEPWQVALLLPRTWDDLRPVVTAFDANDLLGRSGESVVLRGRLQGTPNVYYQPIPRVTARVMDQRGQAIGFTIFGNTADTVRKLTEAANDLCVWGVMDEFRGEPQLGKVEIVRPAWAGRPRPRYPGKPSVIGAGLVRERVLCGLRDALPLAARITDGACGGKPAGRSPLAGRKPCAPVSRRSLARK